MPKQFKPTRVKPGSFSGSYYQRGGRVTDKHNNIKFTPLTFRNIHSGEILSNRGQYLGLEENRRHTYGLGPRKAALPKRYQTRQHKAVMASLRSRGRI